MKWIFGMKLGTQILPNTLIIAVQFISAQASWSSRTRPSNITCKTGSSPRAGSLFYLSFAPLISTNEVAQWIARSISFFESHRFYSTLQVLPFLCLVLITIISVGSVDTKGLMLVDMAIDKMKLLTLVALTDQQRTLRQN